VDGAQAAEAVGRSPERESVAAQTVGAYRPGYELVAEQVLQRDSTNKANAKVIGTAFGLDGTSVEARITSGRRVVRNWNSVGKVENGAWAVEMTAIPMGGPYKIELRAGPTHVAAVDDVLVGDLWVLAGQSNMAGSGFGEASRILHRFTREFILPGGLSAKPRPVLYNSWEATEFNVEEPGQKALAEKAAKIGVERFVMDDGWFGARNNDHAGLGDWTVNPKKFPNGLQPLIRFVNGLGMDFGIWVEPEMVNPDSDLYRKHPDWVMNFPGRPRTEARNQLILNMARDDVKEYTLGWLDKLVTENNIAFLKWDMNRNFSEPGWPEAGPANEKKIWVKYTNNVYEIIDRLRARHPKLEIESCSGGGGRVDLGIMKRTDEVWTSDNTEAFDRLRIQEGFSYAYPAQVMMAWVTDVPNMNGRSTPLQYRFLVAMMGSLGIGNNLNKWTGEDFTLATKMIAYYKTIRPTVQQGALYRLLSPREGEMTANQYVSQDGKQSVLFAFLHSQQYGRPAARIRLRGLDDRGVYRVKPVDGRKLVEKLETASGAYLQNQGLNINLTGDYDSTSILLERVE